jgi:DNA-binding transcriptional MerR regulator
MVSQSQDASSYSLQELAQLVGLKPRTVRSWIQQDLLPGPGARGRGAQYGEEHRRRLHLICRLRDDAGLSLGAIRRLLLGTTSEELARLPADGVAAARGLGHGGSTSNSANQYLDAVLGRPSGSAPPPSREDTPPDLDRSLEAAFFQTSVPRKARAETWWRIPIASDVELHVRAGSNPDALHRFERVADQVRQLLLQGPSK